ncbi:hypothetical protein Trydic_g1488 [Trypoxylus dichotomus]
MGTQWKLETFVIFTVFITICKGQKYITCTTPQNLNACEQVNRTDDIKCLLGRNLVNCLLMTENGEVSFTSVSAEDAFLASSLTKNLVVIAEFTPTNLNGKADFETAVLIRNNIESELNPLKGARFCHPGIDIDKISPLIMKEFEIQTLSQNNLEVCSNEKSKTLAEYYINALDDFFGPSCRPGRWSIVNSTIDVEFKSKYPKLLQLCPPENQKNIFLDSLKCLLNNNGDVALTSLNAIREYNLTAPGALTNYSYLCRNGSRVNVTAGSCTWSRQPWSLLIGNKDSSADLPIDLRNWYVLQPLDGGQLQLSEKYVQSLKELIFPDHLGNSININFDRPSLETYISEFREKPTTENSRLCKFSVGLCVASEEEEKKCKWLQQAALNYGIQPVIDCVTKSSKLECLKAIQNTMADITVVNSNMTYIVNRHNLSIVAFGEEETQYMIRTVLIVNTTTIKSLEDLKGKRGFFSEYGDIAWLAFADLLRQTVWTNPEYYGLELSNFLGNSCMPGIHDTNLEPYPTGVSFEKMCALCGNPTSSSGIESCNADSSNVCYGTEGALKCLELAGDFAVVVLKDKLTLPNNASIMCRNGTLTNNTLNIDNNCALSVTINDQIVARKNDPKNRDIEMMLQELDERFAAQTHTSFRIFDRFGRTKDLIFKDTTLGMEIATISNNKYVKSQIELFENIPRPKTTGDIQDGGEDGNGGGGGANSLHIASFTIIGVSLLSLYWFALI